MQQGLTSHNLKATHIVRVGHVLSLSTNMLLFGSVQLEVGGAPRARVGMRRHTAQAIMMATGQSTAQCLHLHHDHLFPLALTYLSPIIAAKSIMARLVTVPTTAMEMITLLWDRRWVLVKPCHMRAKVGVGRLGHQKDSS
jgi:hypothetical protein